MTLRSIIRFLSLPGLGLRSVADRRMRRIRTAMLSLLNGHSGVEVRRVEQRVQFAENLEALWYLRQDLVSTLTAVGDETTARQQILRITGLFKGWLPSTMVSRTHHRFTT
jgi:hypothetical protein